MMKTPHVSDAKPSKEATKQLLKRGIISIDGAFGIDEVEAVGSLSVIEARTQKTIKTFGASLVRSSQASKN